MSDDYNGVLLEDIDNKFDIILESLNFMATAAQVEAIDARLINVEADVKTIKRVVTDTNRDLRKHTKQLDDHETRISDLEDDGLEFA